MNCSECGKNVTEDSRYCWSCGSEMIRVSQNSEALVVDSQIEEVETLQLSDSERTTTSLGEPKGIGGWLILLIIGQAVTIFQGLNTVKEYTSLLTSGNLSHLMNRGSETYSSSFVTLFWAELLGAGMVVILSAWILFALFGRMKIFRRLMFVFYISNVFFLLLYTGITLTIPDQVFDGGTGSLIAQYISSLFGQMIGFGIWGTYLFKSKRVKNTFGY